MFRVFQQFEVFQQLQRPITVSLLNKFADANSRASIREARFNRQSGQTNRPSLNSYCLNPLEPIARRQLGRSMVNTPELRRNQALHSHEQVEVLATVDPPCREKPWTKKRITGNHARNKVNSDLKPFAAASVSMFR